jgi:hypothetical protein
MLHPIDVSAFSYDEFVRFVFDRPVNDVPWWHVEWMVCTPGVADGISHTVGNGAMLLRHLIRLFRECGELPHAYTDCQIEQGLWFISVMDGLDPPLWDRALPFELRETCIAAMEGLFTGLFARRPLETASLMWWHNFAKSYDLDDGHVDDKDDAAIQQAMFDTILRVLAIDCPHCQESALAGLAALKHPATAEAIGRFLRTHPQLDRGHRREFQDLQIRAAEW